MPNWNRFQPRRYDLPATIMVSPLSAFAFIGASVILFQVKKLLGFVWFYFCRPANYKIYLQGPSPYALVTGATDGIGKGIAKELYVKGFNLILHGRNEEKMKKVVEELKALSSRDGSDIKYFLADASKTGVDFEKAVKDFEGLNITLVIHNAGGSEVRPTTFDGWAADEHVQTINLNAVFPTLLTHALLPGLRKTAIQRPVLVAFIGSFSSKMSLARIPIYASSKAYIDRLTRTLQADERFDSPNTKLSFMYLEVAEVNSSSMHKPVSFRCPSSDQFGKSVVNSLGCGKVAVTPYIGHAISAGFVSWLPTSILDKVGETEMRKTIEFAKRD